MSNNLFELVAIVELELVLEEAFIEIILKFVGEQSIDEIGFIVFGSCSNDGLELDLHLFFGVERHGFVLSFRVQEEILGYIDSLSNIGDGPLVLHLLVKMLGDSIFSILLYLLQSK